MITQKDVTEFVVGSFANDLGEGGENLLKLTSTHHFDPPLDHVVIIETMTGQQFTVTISEVKN